MTAIADFPVSAQSTDDVFIEHSVCPYCYCPVVTAGRGWMHSDNDRLTCEGGRSVASEWTRTATYAIDEAYGDGVDQGRENIRRQVHDVINLQMSHSILPLGLDGYARLLDAITEALDT